MTPWFSVLVLFQDVLLPALLYCLDVNLPFLLLKVVHGEASKVGSCMTLKRKIKSTVDH